MTDPEVPAEELGALTKAARDRLPPGFDASVVVREGYLQVVVGRLPRGPAFGGVSRLADVPAPSDRVAWVAGAIPSALDGVIGELVKPLLQTRAACREAWRNHDTQANADAYREACRELDLERMRLHTGAYIP